METQGWSNFVEYIINEKSYEVSKCLGTFQTSLVPIHHKLHSRLYDIEGYYMTMTAREY